MLLVLVATSLCAGIAVRIPASDRVRSSWQRRRSRTGRGVRPVRDCEPWEEFDNNGHAPHPVEFKPKVWQAEAGAGKPACFFSELAFADLGATPELIKALQHSGAHRPSHTQALGFRPILNGQDAILADQTGSGKTLAYLAPLVQRLRALEEAKGRTPPCSVRALVLVPTSELAQQVSGALR